MIKRTNEMKKNSRVSGSSNINFLHLLDTEETGGIFKLAAKITLEPGAAVEPHAHENEGEIYIIISGAAVADDNGTIVELKPGDVMWTADGKYHAISNKSDEPMVMYAIIAVK